MKAVATILLALVAIAASQFLPQQQPQATLLQRTHIQDDHAQVSQSYSLSDGTHVVEEGKLTPNNDGSDYVLVKTGLYRYITPDGVTREVKYTADQNGFRADVQPKNV